MRGCWLLLARQGALAASGCTRGTAPTRFLARIEWAACMCLACSASYCRQTRGTAQAPTDVIPCRLWLTTTGPVGGWCRPHHHRSQRNSADLSSAHWLHGQKLYNEASSLAAAWWRTCRSLIRPHAGLVSAHRSSCNALSFFDFKAAFPSSSWKWLFLVLERAGIPTGLLDFIRALCTRVSALSADWRDELFRIVSGILQGCPL